MRILLFVLALLFFAPTLALAQGCGQQNPNCIVPTAPPGTNNNQAASTAFVETAVSGSSVCPGCVPGNIIYSISPGVFGDVGVPASLFNSLTAFNTLCRLEGTNGPVDACPPITAVAPLGIVGSTLNVNTIGANGQFFAGAGNQTNTGGTSNIGIGQLVLFLLTNGTGNIGLGSLACSSINSGVNNLCIGSNSGTSMTNALDNVSIGSGALQTNSTGGSSTVIGINGFHLATGGFNTGVGEQVGLNVTTGQVNAFFGAGAGGGITTGSKNSIFGACAGLPAALSNAIMLCDGDGNIRLNWDNTAGNWVQKKTDFTDQIYSTTGTPTIASGACGATTNGTVGSGSTNQSGFINIGAAATTTCTLSWSATLSMAPNSCVFFPGNAAAAATGTTVTWAGAPSTASVVLNGSALANTTYRYLCL